VCLSPFVVGDVTPRPKALLTSTRSFPVLNLFPSSLVRPIRFDAPSDSVIRLGLGLTGGRAFSGDVTDLTTVL
jgi:hypothetical protein